VALQGELDFVNQRFAHMTVALIDAKGCIRAQQQIHGDFKKPVFEKLSTVSHSPGRWPVCSRSWGICFRAVSATCSTPVRSPPPEIGVCSGAGSLPGRNVFPEFMKGDTRTDPAARCIRLPLTSQSADRRYSLRFMSK